MAKTDHFVMSVTTFAPNGDFDEAAFRQWLRRFIDQGLGVYVASAGNGEGHALTPDDLRRLYAVTVDEVKGRVPVHANLPEEHTARQTIAQAKLAADAGIDVLHMYLLESRHGMKPTEVELRTYFDDVFSAIDHPVCLAVNPTICPVPRPQLVAQIVKDHPQIVGIRLSHQPEIYMIQIKDLVEREVTYHIQQETALLIPLAMGASIFSGDANILPKTYRRFLDLAAASKLEETGAVLAQIRRFHAHGARFSSNAPRSLKMAMRGLKLPGGEGGLRRPYVMPSREEYDAYMDGLLKLRIPEIDELAKAAGLRIP